MNIIVTNIGTSIGHNMDTSPRLWFYSPGQGARELDVVFQREDALVLMSNEHHHNPFFFQGRAIIVCTRATPGIAAEDVTVEIVEDTEGLPVGPIEERTMFQRVSDTAHGVINYFLDPLLDWAVRRVLPTLTLP